MPGRLDFEYSFNNKTAQPIDPETTMRMYFLGDFSGPLSASEHGLDNTIVKIDVDNFDDVMAKMRPTVRLPSGHIVTFNELEDFHPDTLFDTSAFKNLKRLKRELGNSNTAEQAALEIVTTFNIQGQQSTNPDVNTEDKDNMIERLLGQKPVESDLPEAGKFDAFLANLISPHIIKNTLPEHQSLMILIDTGLEELMNSILHLPEFQSLESVWRSVRDVIFNEEYDEANQFFYVVNTDRNALQKAQQGDPVFATKLSQHIKNIDGDSDDVLVANYQFSAENDDISALNYLASFAETLKCQMLGGADEALTTASSESLWQQFRSTPQANHIALVYPRVLLRIPYGKKRDEVECFAFEEFRQEHLHHQLLWGNAAFACARLLIRQYHSGAAFSPVIEGLPAFVFDQDDTTQLHACGEFLLSEQQLAAILKQGIMSFASFRNKNSIQLFGNEIRAVN